MPASFKKQKRTVRQKTPVSANPKIKLSDPTTTERRLKTPYDASQLKKFRTVLVGQKNFLMGNITHMEEQALRKSRQEASGDLSNIPIHIADIGTDNYEQDFTLGLIENEDHEIQEIDAALERIGEKSYGVCEKCSKHIPTKRLMAIPYARLCITCKEKEEKVV
ncbi:MAG: TraR/DksA family transcriptional regulator [Planctomycetota bacterium]